ncbi:MULTISPECIES: acyl-CoA thioesterase [unclassified Psychrobacter]|jgi:acyl-CoA thioesterase FadM|uniref:acyl-CoA thioesterase n=1 Tax=unclassified Psychrobacter TaxID=196806 RepID=UPI0003F98323|nr:MULTISPECIES: acyl-CoA thioesterase [unclassified Psychrobacter]
MYPFLRYSKSIVSAVIANKKGQSLDLAQTSEVMVRCSLTDLDPMLEMNNGRVLTVYDIGRTDFIIRTGLGRLLLKQRWGMVVAGSTIQYRKRIRLLDKITIRTHIVGIDERWIYLEHSMWVKGKPCSSMLLRTGVTEGGRVVDTARVLEGLGKADLKLPPTGYVAEWIESDSDRPWPPEG